MSIKCYSLIIRSVAGALVMDKLFSNLIAVMLFTGGSKAGLGLADDEGL